MFEVFRFSPVCSWCNSGDMSCKSMCLCMVCVLWTGLDAAQISDDFWRSATTDPDDVVLSTLVCQVLLFFSTSIATEKCIHMILPTYFKSHWGESRQFQEETGVNEGFGWMVRIVRAEDKATPRRHRVHCPLAVVPKAHCQIATSAWPSSRRQHVAHQNAFLSPLLSCWCPGS